MNNPKWPPLHAVTPAEVAPGCNLYGDNGGSSNGRPSARPWRLFTEPLCVTKVSAVLGGTRVDGTEADGTPAFVILSGGSMAVVEVSAS